MRRRPKDRWRLRSAPLLILIAGSVHGQGSGSGPWPDAERLEEFLEEAPIIARRELGVGVTNALRVELRIEGEERTAVLKKFDRPNDSWRHEIAAYELDKLLGLGMVPPTVPRKDKGRWGCLQLWVDGSLLESLESEPTDLEAWRRQISEMWLFDYLTANNDRHAHNVLAAGDGRVVLIDNSRAFEPYGRPLRSIDGPGGATRALFWRSAFDPTVERYPTVYRPALLERLRALERAELKAALGAYIASAELRRLLERRDQILAAVGSDAASSR